jgi:hypothetical protein
MQTRQSTLGEIFAPPLGDFRVRKEIHSTNTQMNEEGEGHFFSGASKRLVVGLRRHTSFQKGRQSCCERIEHTRIIIPSKADTLNSLL